MPAPTQAHRPKLRLPQLRVLRGLMPEDPSLDRIDWPSLTRSQMAAAAGYTAISGTINRVLMGIRPNSSTGDPHPGLIELGYLEALDIDVEGIIEVHYRITPEGVKRYLAHVVEVGEELPKHKSKETCTNGRYLSAKPPN